MRHTVLVIGNEETLVALMKSLLEQNGYHVISLEESRRTLEMACNEKPHLIVLETTEVESNGGEVCRHKKYLMAYLFRKCCTRSTLSFPDSHLEKRDQQASCLIPSSYSIPLWISRRDTSKAQYQAGGFLRDTHLIPICNYV